jgi:hypothetical protein
MRTGRLHAWDCFIAINGTRVESMTHQAIFDYLLVYNLMPLYFE